jgi:hypothetical protein
MLKNPTFMKELLLRQYSRQFLACFPASLLGFSAGHCHRALVDELRIIRTQMGMHTRSEMVAVYGTHCASHALSVKVTDLFTSFVSMKASVRRNT